MRPRYPYARALAAGVFVLTAIGAGVAGRPVGAGAGTAVFHNGLVAFQRNPDNQTYEVWSVRPDGMETKRVIINSASLPAYSGDGTKLAFCTADGLVLATADGASAQNLGQIACSGFRLSVNADASKFVSVANDDVVSYQSHVVIWSAAGERLDLFGDDDATEMWPAFSPDGSSIAYVRVANGNQEIWHAGADGSNPHKVAEAPGFNTQSPSVSPDETQIVFSSSVSNSDNVYLVNVDGTDLHEVNAGIRGRFPSFSPDGQFIVFTGSPIGGGPQGVFTMRSDGTEVTRLTDPADGTDRSPTWQRLDNELPPTTTSTTIANVAPVARFTIKQQAPHYLFGNGLTSTDSDGTIASYTWRWGDYSKPNTFKYGWHQYARAGTYLVRLTVTDNKGAATTRGVWVKVT